MNVAIYIRSKSTDLNHIYSHSRQASELQAWCKSQNHSIIKVYQESEPKAPVNQRPVLQRLIDDACLPCAPFDAVVVKDFNRISRDFREFFLCKERLNQHGIKLISLEQPETESGHKLVTGIMSEIFAEYERSQQSSYIKRGILYNARHGGFNGGVPPFGYLIIDNRLVVNHEESAIVEKIFNGFDSGFQNGKICTPSGIAAELNQLGHSFRRRPWTGRTVRRILKNSVYTGQYIYNKLNSKTRTLKPESEWVRIAVEPIISDEVFEKVQTLLVTKTKSLKEKML